MDEAFLPWLPKEWLRSQRGQKSLSITADPTFDERAYGMCRVGARVGKAEGLCSVGLRSPGVTLVALMVASAEKRGQAGGEEKDADHLT